MGQARRKVVTVEGMKIELRILSPDDWQLWRSVRLAALTEAPDAFGSRLQDWTDAAENRWRERLAIPGAVDLVAIETETNAPVGMVTGTPDLQDCGRVKLISLWVDPAARGHGVATTLITAVARWAAREGARSLTLSVMPNNDAARLTYERNGFIASPEPGDVLPDGRRELVMVRSV